MTVTTIGSKGRITTPKDIRERLSLHAGDKVDVRVDEGRGLRLRPVSLKPADVFGILSTGKEKRLSVEEMDAGVAKSIKKGRL